MAAVLLFGAAAFLMSRADPRRETARPSFKLPRMDGQATRRLERRKTLPRFSPTPNEPQAAEEEGKPASVLWDPVIAAMPASVDEVAVVVEANALRHSPVGRLFIDCFVARSAEKLERLKRDVGLDVLEDLDRATIIDDTFLLTGHFAKTDWQKLLEGASARVLDERTTLWTRGTNGQVLATWRQQMLVAADSEAEVMAVIDRLEGRTPAAESPVIAESDSYGEIYGVVTPSAMAKVLERERPDLARRLAEAIGRFEVHVDASSDVGVVVNAVGKSQEVSDLGRAVGGALAVGRLAARAQGDRELADVLDYARVVPDESGTSFQTELALPIAFFQEKLRDCARDGARAATEEPAGPESEAAGTTPPDPPPRPGGTPGP